MRTSRRELILTLAAASLCGPVYSRKLSSGTAAALARNVADDSRLDRVLDMAKALIGTGLTAGVIYPEVWIRDLNTFIELGLTVSPPADYRAALKTMLTLQGPGGDIPDGYVPTRDRIEPSYRTSPLMPGLAAHKNTVETDQESSLVQAVARYVRVTGDRAFLSEIVGGRLVIDRLGSALDYVMKDRWSAAHGLAWSGTKPDWGDVQPEDVPGTSLNANSHRAIGVYDNALLAVALAEFIALLPKGKERIKRQRQRARLLENIRKHLWRGPQRGFLPHVYLEKGSPFPKDFDESVIYYHGGTAVAIEAGVLTKTEIRPTLDQMRRNVRAAGAGTIGLTMYPAYPAGLFKNPILATPYTYQNGGDWDWFGGRMIRQLVAYGAVEEAYRELSPMLERILRVDDFPEWWSLDNQPKGSGRYRGSAGVMASAILALHDWGKKNEH